MTTRRGIVSALLFAAAAAATGAARAQDLRIGLASEPTSMDPHYHNLSPNNALVRHVFEPLISSNEVQALGPGLAVSWRVVDDTTWELKLRPGVIWHDGAPFTADDVLFTFERAPNVPRSPSSFASYVRGKTFEKVDDLTVRIKTAAPEPLMLNQLSQIPIISAKAARSATTEDFNAGRGAVGTGPYKFAEFVPGARIVLVRNDAWWGGKPAWAKITLKPITSDPTRVAALLSNDVDVIEAVPTQDAKRLKGDASLNVASALSNRVVYFHMDHFRQTSPFITSNAGQPIPNPLLDLKVRQALSKALNRKAIVERVMENEAVPASQFLPDSYPGTSKTLKPVEYDLAGAKALLAEAGFPNGFKMTIHGPNGRYTNDVRIIEAAAQMFSRAGVETKVETMAPAVFFTRASQGAPDGTPEFSFILVGWSSGTGEPSDSLKPLVGTFDKATGFGTTNRGRYSNPAVDDLIRQALRTIDDSRRAAVLAQATEVAINDAAIIPLHYQLNTWAARKGFKVTPRSDEYTLATSVTPQ